MSHLPEFRFQFTSMPTMNKEQRNLVPGATHQPRQVSHNNLLKALNDRTNKVLTAKMGDHLTMIERYKATPPIYIPTLSSALAAIKETHLPYVSTYVPSSRCPIIESFLLFLLSPMLYLYGHLPKDKTLWPMLGS